MIKFVTIVQKKNDKKNFKNEKKNVTKNNFE
jgi:hypothetical protein